MENRNRRKDLERCTPLVRSPVPDDPEKHGDGVGTRSQSRVGEKNTPSTGSIVCPQCPAKHMDVEDSEMSFLARRDGARIPEVLENIFKFLDVDQLKRCRFVCRVWNNEASRALQKTSHVYLQEDSVRSHSFHELSSQRERLGMPNPFRRYFLSIDLFQDLMLQEIIQGEGASVVELYMNQSPSSNNSSFQRTLHRILIKSSKTLRYMRLALKDGINLGLTTPDKHPLYLPALRDFGFWEMGRGSNKEECLGFIIEIINAAPNLKQLCSSCGDVKVLKEILVRGNLTNLEGLYAESVKGEQVRQLAIASLPSLKSLILQSNIDELDEHELVPSSILHDMVKNFAPSLEELNLCWISSTLDMDFPCCPKLKTLNLDGWDGSLGVFDPYRLPQLSSVIVTNHGEDDMDSIFNPHEGVEKLTIECTRGVGPDGMYTDEEFDYLLLYSSIQFPRIKHLDLTMTMTDETVRSIIRSFPQVETLILDTGSKISSHVFTGRNRFALEKFVRDGNDLYDIDAVPMPSLRDLKQLKRLVLGRFAMCGYPEGFYLTNDIIQFGIAEIPSLKEFQFNWNPELSVSMFRESLTHLEKIVVTNSCDSELQGQIRELFAVMSQVTLESKIFDD